MQLKAFMCFFPEGILWAHHSEGAQRAPSSLENGQRMFIHRFHIKKCGKYSEKLLGEAQHHCEICVCLQGLTIRFVKWFSFVFEAIVTHDGKSVAEGKAVPCSQTSRQESSSYSPAAPLRCGWAPAWGQLWSFMPGICSGPENISSCPVGNKQSAAGATWWWIPAWPHSAKGQAWCNFFCPDIIFLGKRQPRFGGTSGWLTLLGTFGTRSSQVMAAWQRKLERRVHFPLGYKGWPSLPIALPKVPAERVVRPERLYPLAFHRILIKEGFTCFISAPTSKTSCNPAWVTSSCQKHREVGSGAKEM